jgi:hypothetical protein
MSDFLHALPAILIITLIFGGWVIGGVYSTITKNWRRVRECERLAALKHSLAAKGMTAEQIVTYINAGADLPRA